MSARQNSWRTLTLTLALLLSACAVLPPAPTLTPPPPPTAPAGRCSFPRLAFSSAPGPLAYYDKGYGGAALDAWRSSTPEEQGLDSQILSRGVAYLAKKSQSYSLLILRNDTIVVEEYFHGGRVNRSANIQSASKSFLSALVGIAIREGYIESVDQKVSEFLPEYFVALDDPRKAEVTLRHLLTMRSGFSWGDNIVSGLPGDDWVQSALAMPLDSAPGHTFHYSSVSSYLVSVVLTRATGMSTCEFAYRYLLDPLGITVENWYLDPQGYALGGTGMFITPREMARFGLLFLRRGEWAGEQLVPAEWVSESQGPRVVVSAAAKVHYGYHWWQHIVGGYRVVSALGYGGQNICIVPGLDLVLVTTADSSSSVEGIDPFYFLTTYVFPALAPESSR